MSSASARPTPVRQGRGIKAALLLVVSASAAAAYVWFRPSPPTAPRDVRPTDVAALPDQPALQAPPAQHSAAPSGTGGATPTAVATPAQHAAQPTTKQEVAALLSIYDEMSDLLEASPEDCDALAYGLSTIIDAGAPRVRGLIQQGGAASELLDPALRADAVARAQRLGSAMNGALPRCATQLNTELARMRELVAASSR